MIARGPLLADWAARYHGHPMRNRYTRDERDMLTDELLGDPTTRLYASATGGLTLDTWAELRLVSMVAAALGIEMEIPAATQPAPEAPAATDIADARARLIRVSAIAGLPE